MLTIRARPNKWQEAAVLILNHLSWSGFLVGPVPARSLKTACGFLHTYNKCWFILTPIILVFLETTIPFLEKKQISHNIKATDGWSEWHCSGGNPGSWYSCGCYLTWSCRHVPCSSFGFRSLIFKARWMVWVFGHIIPWAVFVVWQCTQCCWAGAASLGCTVEADHCVL